MNCNIDEILNLVAEENKLAKEILGKHEVWRTIKQFPNYQVSSFGNIKSIVTGGKIMKPSQNKDEYYRIGLWRNKKVMMRVHRLVAIEYIPNISNKPSVDHIDHNPKNNNISNLRWATVQENCRNAQQYKNNKSGFIGVSYHKRNKQWCAQINIKGKRKHIGIFPTAEQASEAYQERAKKLYGEFHNSQ